MISQSQLSAQTNILKCTYLNQEEAQNTDVELMTQLGFSIDVLMELAGQSIAHAINHANINYHKNSLKKFLFLCGPGNNGGDGLVAARHLSMMKMDCTILLFKEPNKDLYVNLLKTCQSNEISIIKYDNEFNTKESQSPNNISQYLEKYDMIVDGIFGFSFKPPIRTPYDIVLNCFNKIQTPIFSIDIPSGWDVEKGNTQNLYEPQYLISLTLPKLVAKHFTKKHYLGGRFIPKCMIKKYGWEVPIYTNDTTFLELN